MCIVASLIINTINNIINYLISVFVNDKLSWIIQMAYIWT